MMASSDSPLGAARPAEPRLSEGLVEESLSEPAMTVHESSSDGRDSAGECIRHEHCNAEDELFQRIRENCVNNIDKVQCAIHTAHSMEESTS